MSEFVNVPIPLEPLAKAVAEIVIERVRGELGLSPWMSRARAAEYLDVPVSRLEKDRTVPCRRWDGRVLYHRGELDTWVFSHFKKAA